MTKEEKQEHKVIIGNKGFEFYLSKVMLLLEGYQTVTISATGKHVNELERICRLVTDRSKKEVVEAKRYSEPFAEGLHAVVCQLKEK